MIQVENLKKSYSGKPAITNVGFQVRKGQITALLGPNGAGKSTTLKLLAGYLRPELGIVRYSGKILEENRLEIQSQLGYLPESGALYPEMSIWEYLHFQGKIRNLEGVTLEHAITKVVKTCDLSSHLHSLVGSLSKGFKQRVALAGVLIHDPEYIILDEPTSGLDPIQISGIRNLIKALAKDKTVLLSTHILQEVEELADHVILISKGKVVLDSPIGEITKDQEARLVTNIPPNLIHTILSGGDILQVEKLEEVPKDGFYAYSIKLSVPNPEILFEKIKASSYTLRELTLVRKSLESIFESRTK